MRAKWVMNYGRGRVGLLLWEECPTCEGMTKAPDTFGCFDCYNGGRLPYWPPPGEWLLEHLKRIWWGLVDGPKAIRNLLDSVL